MRGAISVQEAGAISEITGNPGLPRRNHLEACAQSVALIVVEKENSVGWRTEICKSTSDSSRPLNCLPRIGKMDIATMEKLR